MRRKNRVGLLEILNPKKWSIACWLLLILWLIPSLVWNLPIEPDFTHFEANEDPFYNQRYIAYDRVTCIGWPFIYLEIADSGTQPATRSDHAFYAISNFVLVSVTLVSLIYAVQSWIPRFSILTLMVATAIIALLIALGQLVFSSQNYKLQTGFIMAIYFSPIAAAMVFIGYNFVRRRKLTNDRTLPSNKDIDL